MTVRGAGVWGCCHPYGRTHHCRFTTSVFERVTMGVVSSVATLLVVLFCCWHFMLQRYLFCRCRFLFTCTFGIHIRTARSCGPAGLYVLYLWSVTVILCYWLVRHFIDVQFSVFVFETCVPASIQMTLRQHQPEGLSIVLPLLCVVVLHFAYSICGKSAMGAHVFFFFQLIQLNTWWSWSQWVSVHHFQLQLHLHQRHCHCQLYRCALYAVNCMDGYSTLYSWSCSLLVCFHL